MTTIGLFIKAMTCLNMSLRYGSRYINTNCPIIVFFTLLQSFSGVIVTGVEI